MFGWFRNIDSFLNNYHGVSNVKLTRTGIKFDASDATWYFKLVSDDYIATEEDYVITPFFKKD